CYLLLRNREFVHFREGRPPSRPTNHSGLCNKGKMGRHRARPSHEDPTSAKIPGEAAPPGRNELTLPLCWVPFNAFMKTVISTREAPAAVGPYAQGIAAGPFVFCSGQIPLDPATGQLVNGDIAVRTERVLKNLRAVLEARGMGLDHVVKTVVFLTD